MRACLRKLAALLLVSSVPRVSAAQPDVGHKIPGAVGSNAGTQPDPGLYFANRFVYYDAIRLRDRDGEPIDVPGFDIDAWANAAGVSGTWKLRSGLHLGAAVAAPLAGLRVSVDDARAAVDRSGFGDVFVKPAQIGGRWPHLDLLTSYGFYAPTRQFNRRGLAGPQWSHQFSVGSTVYFDAKKRWRISALLSYDLFQEKLDVEVTRGDTVQIQGGAAGRLLEVFEVGVAGYGLWQILDDRGSDLPPVLRGRRDRVFGLGPELNILLHSLGVKLGLRYVRDFGVQARPEAQLVVADVAVLLWSPG